MRRRIVSLTVLTSLVCTALFAIPLAFGASYYFLARQKAEMQRIAYGVASAAADNLTSGAQLAALEKRTGGVSVGLYGLNGSLISGVGNSSGLALVRSALTGTPSDGSVADRIAVAVPVIDNDTVKGAVLATRSMDSVRWPIGLSWAALAGLAVAALGASWSLARHQASRLARPIEQMSVAAERLGDGDFGSIVHPVGIPEIDSVNRSLEQTSARLRVLLERERALASDASHQIRTPLTGLRLMLERAAQSPGDNADSIAAAQEIIERLELTVTDMLQLVRGTPRPDTALSIESLVEHVRQRWDSTFGSAARPLSVHVAADLPAAHIPAGSARQILNVLVDNAGNHGVGQVSVVFRESLGSLAIDVSQQGPPLTAAAQSLFVERTGAGAGIGLPLARAIAQSAAARLILTATDPPTFTLLIPPAAAGGATPAADGPDDRREMARPPLP